MAYKKIQKDGYTLVVNENGATLGYSEASGVPIVEQDGLAFKNLSKDGQLKPYEDWRLPYRERAADLAKRLSVEQIAGLMLYSSHQMVPAASVGNPFAPSLYGGKVYEESGAAPSDLTDQQKAFLQEDFLRHVLVVQLQDTKTAVEWNNKLQSFVESMPFGVPANNSSDPRHGSDSDAEYNAGAGGSISKWPEGIAMSATFDPALNQRFAEVASSEYRALGLTTALSPQIDMATEPRWMRFPGTFGESPKLAADMARTFCDGMQTSQGDKETQEGWGYDSVNAMVKHWPGGGTGESGRDAHYAFGKYGVFPGGRFEEHMRPFLEGAFALRGKTGKASAVMPYYSIPYGQDPSGKNVGNSYSKFIIKDLLRDKYQYDGVVCTDWGITGAHGGMNEFFVAKCWGVEELTEAQQHLLLILNGVDQFGGNNRTGPILEAYALGCAELGEEAMRSRLESSAQKLLLNIFRCGLFENPYLNYEDSAQIAGHPQFMKEGYEAQQKSVVVLKNKNQTLPVQKRQKVYVPNRHIEPYYGFFRHLMPAEDKAPVRKEILDQYFEVVDSPQQADLALVFIESPLTDCYQPEDVAQGGNGYLPLSLQYRPYTAEKARSQSIAGGDPNEDFTNRSYQGKTSRAANEQDLDNVIQTRQQMGTKPVIVCLTMKNPTVVAEFEPYADAIVADFSVQKQAVLDIVTGQAQPQGLLPLQMPKDMQTVETQLEDVAFDMECYTDECGNTYDFGFGLSFTGVLDNSPAQKYRKA